MNNPAIERYRPYGRFRILGGGSLSRGGGDRVAGGGGGILPRLSGHHDLRSVVSAKASARGLSMNRASRDSLGGKAHRPSGAEDCSHGWSPPKADGTRGERAKKRRNGEMHRTQKPSWFRRFDVSTFSDGAAETRNQDDPPPLWGGAKQETGHHGFRFVRLAANCAPPVATFLDPLWGSKKFPPELSRTRTGGSMPHGGAAMSSDPRTFPPSRAAMPSTGWPTTF